MQLHAHKYRPIAASRLKDPSFFHSDSLSLSLSYIYIYIYIYIYHNNAIEPHITYNNV